ncbi:MAG: calcium/sodium antiporter [Gammaproteobacteria bacterium]|nr:calcium/sodium antiporter [Gammaproteobacteria bacterium]
MLLWIAAITIGFALLVWGADRFVMGASSLARNLGVSPLIIGLTIVGFGTSAPEMLVSGVAAFTGNPNLGMGNAIGSNITNIALVLGMTALISPLTVHSQTLKREFPVLLLIMGVALLLLWDRHLGRMDGAILLAGLLLLIIWMVRIGLKEHAQPSASTANDPLDSAFDNEIPKGVTTPMAIFWLVAGLFILLGSSRMLVWGAVSVAEWFGISDLIIGLTIVAIGTSLPELAASVMSALKKEDDIAIGNVLGSNMFNLLAVLGLPGVILPAPFDDAVITRDFLVMGSVTLLLLVMAYGVRGPGRINRIEGGILLLIFCGYLTYLYLSVAPAATPL